jgi:hypothetical protein
VGDFCVWGGVSGGFVCGGGGGGAGGRGRVCAPHVMELPVEGPLSAAGGVLAVKGVGYTIGCVLPL